MASLQERDRSGPDFVCIGAQKAGTTWLYDRLREQERYWLPPVKEIHFFNRVCPHELLLGVETLPGGLWRPALDQGVSNFVRSARWLRRFYLGEPSTRWYRSLFPDEVVGERIAGDMTPAYSTLDERGVAFARRVLRAGCRVFVVLRNPVDRAWSAIKMKYRWKGEDIADEEINALLEELEAPTHRLRGDYGGIVRRWRAAFGDDFRVFLYDHLRKAPGPFLESVADFLGAPVDLGAARLSRRSNYDPTDLRMPGRLRERLLDRYDPEIRALEEEVRGLEVRWLRG